MTLRLNLRLHSNIIRKRIFVLLVLIVLGLILFLSIKNDPSNCFLDSVWKDGKTLQEVSENSKLKLHSTSKNVFFHETSCNVNGVIKLNARQSCAIESAALMNPDHNIYVLFTSQVGFRNTTNLRLIDALSSYPNIHFNFLNLTKYAQNTPLENWIKNGELFRSNFVNSHTSDVLRYLSLWKYGGTYLDLDIVMQKPLNTQNPNNYAGAESAKFVAVGIINLEGETGHEIADLCVKDLLENFNGIEWGKFYIYNIEYKRKDRASKFLKI
ncbi:unnamed protein product [Chironomus riparius]|uniref:Alpha-1,4-N-acetylglucosaminyltransferase n=1 Tax=Chironomus riparius TaxID=315576 RepID=A0A9P0IPA7_9DIPT|nr:unnamed protein product [Chironomus riparius]